MPTVEEGLRAQLGSDTTQFMHVQLAGAIFRCSVAKTRAMLCAQGMLSDKMPLACMPNVVQHQRCNVEYYIEALEDYPQDMLYAIIRNPVLAGKYGTLCMILDEHKAQRLTMASLHDMMFVDPPPPPANASTAVKTAATKAAALAAIAPIIWTPRNVSMENLACRSRYTWLSAVWCRVNLSAAYLVYYAINHRHARHCLKEKLRAFEDAHIACVRYLDSLDDPCDDAIDAAHLESLYAPIGISHYDGDRDLIHIETERVTCTRRPLQIIAEDAPHMAALHWRVEAVVREMREGRITWASWRRVAAAHYDPLELSDAPQATLYTHRVYAACTYILAQCTAMYSNSEHTLNTTEVNDALYFYHACFLDLFYFCLGRTDPRMDDAWLRTPNDELTSLTPLSYYYPSDVRAYTSRDLPDCFHEIVDIPLRGENIPTATAIAGYIQKCLPFCGQQRGLVKRTRQCFYSEPGFAEIFSCVMWCMLTDMYPARASTACRVFDMRILMRSKQLCDDHSALLESVELTALKGRPGFIGEQSRGCVIIKAAFMLWYIAMIADNTAYMAATQPYIDWACVRESTRARAQLIRHSDLYHDDPFARARLTLSHIKVRPRMPVYRYRTPCLVLRLKDMLLKLLGKYVHASLHKWSTERSAMTRHRRAGHDPAAHRHEFFENAALFACLCSAGADTAWERGVALATRTIAGLSSDVAPAVKTRILNIVIKLPPSARFTRLAFSILTQPGYGDLHPDAVAIVMELVDVYHGACMPAALKTVINKFTPVEARTIAWYLNAVSIVDNINVAPLHAEHVAAVDIAMKHRRYHMYPGQRLSPAVFDVAVNLCCQNTNAGTKTIAGTNTAMGTRVYGSVHIMYDMQSHRLLCAKSQKALAAAAAAVGVIETEAEDDGNENGDFIQMSKQNEKQRSSNAKRKGFKVISCKNSPIIRIPLRGWRLVNGTQKGTRFQMLHCPRCAGFHRYAMSGWGASADGTYRCGECAAKEHATGTHVHRCDLCRARVSQKRAAKLALVVMDSDADPRDAYQHVYFCPRHFKYMKKASTYRQKKYLYPWARRLDLAASKKTYVGRRRAK